MTPASIGAGQHTSTSQSESAITFVRHSGSLCITWGVQLDAVVRCAGIIAVGFTGREM